jgi:hypothetical protein
MSNVRDRDALHRLIDALRPEDVRTAQRVLQALSETGDSLLAALTNAPVDDEDETESERESADRARRDIREGQLHSQDEVRRKLRRA